MIGFILVSRPVYPRGNSQILAIDFICRKACVGSRRFQLKVAWFPVFGIIPVIRLPLCSCVKLCTGGAQYVDVLEVLAWACADDFHV